MFESLPFILMQDSFKPEGGGGGGLADTMAQGAAFGIAVRILVIVLLCVFIAVFYFVFLRDTTSRTGKIVSQEDRDAYKKMMREAEDRAMGKKPKKKKKKKKEVEEEAEDE